MGEWSRSPSRKILEVQSRLHLEQVVNEALKGRPNDLRRRGVGRQLDGQPKGSPPDVQVQQPVFVHLELQRLEGKLFGKPRVHAGEQSTGNASRIFRPLM